MKAYRNIIFIFCSIFLVSCNINITNQIKGNGIVTTETRTIQKDFDAIKGSAGLQVYVTQGDHNEIRIEADENLLDVIKTDVKKGKLHIKTSKNIRSAKSKKVFVTYKSINTLQASSGADVISQSVITAENISLQSSSGASVDAEVFTKELVAKTSSGADIKASGQAKNVIAQASSGSKLNAQSLQSLTCIAKASSGASIIVNVNKSIDARASSGGSIKYHGNPDDVSMNRSSSGTVKKI